MRKTALTIAGSDSSGGAGIQADLKTMLANGVYGMSVITALTAQNTMGVSEVLSIPKNFIEEQIDMVCRDIFPDSVKIGMVDDSEVICSIEKKLIEYRLKNIVIDPVMVSTSGYKLLKDEAIESLIDKLFPLATVITPNIPEAEILIGYKIDTAEDMEEVALDLYKKFKVNILLKGGHNVNDANDLLCIAGSLEWIKGERIENSNTHGTGCTLSSAIASNLAKGKDLREAIIKAKEYISNALRSDLNLGQGSGPLDHGFMIGK